MAQLLKEEDEEKERQRKKQEKAARRKEVGAAWAGVGGTQWHDATPSAWCACEAPGDALCLTRVLSVHLWNCTEKGQRRRRRRRRGQRAVALAGTVRVGGRWQRR